MTRRMYRVTYEVWEDPTVNILDLAAPDPPKAAPATDPELRRITSKVGTAILDWARRHGIGRTFHAEDIATYLRDVAEVKVSPGSESRVLRNLRATGQLAYTLLSKPTGTYRLDGVSP